MHLCGGIGEGKKVREHGHVYMLGWKSTPVAFACCGLMLRIAWSPACTPVLKGIGALCIYMEGWQATQHLGSILLLI